jgi:hypothetical protein
LISYWVREPALVQELVGHGAATGRIDRRREHRLVLRERLLGAQRPRQVQLAARPGAARAERSHIRQDVVDLLRREHAAERRHPAIERAHGAAALDDRVPVGVGLDGVECAVGEVGNGDIESEGALRHPPAVRSMARGARRFVERLAARDGRVTRLGCRNRGEQMNDCGNEDDSRAEARQERVEDHRAPEAYQQGCARTRTSGIL